MIIPDLKCPTVGTDNLTNAQGVLKKYRGHVAYEKVPWDIAGNWEGFPFPSPSSLKQAKRLLLADWTGKGGEILTEPMWQLCMEIGDSLQLKPL